jgi:hypothetical protein
LVPPAEHELFVATNVSANREAISRPFLVASSSKLCGNSGEVIDFWHHTPRQLDLVIISDSPRRWQSSGPESPQ